MAREAIAQRDWRDAVAALDQLDEPEPALQAEVQALRERLRREEREVVQLKNLQRDVDLERHRPTRFRMALAGGILWMAWNCACGWLYRSGTFRFDHALMIGSEVVTMAVYGTALFAVRRTLMKTRIDRHGLLLLLTCFAGTLLFWISAAWLGIGVRETIALTMQVYLFFPGALAASVDRRVVWTLLPVLPLAALATLDVEYAFEIAGLNGLLVGLGLAWTWRRAGDVPPLLDEPRT